MLVRDGNRAVAAERWLARQHLVENGAQRIEVRARVDRFALSLLRREVRGRPQHRGRLGQRFRSVGAGDAEVHHLHVAARGEHDVPGLHITVGDPGPVREGQCLRNRLPDLDGSLRHERRVLADHARQGLPLHVLHHDEVRAVVGSGVEDRDHVGVVQRGGGLRLSPKARHERVVPRELVAEDLDGHGPIQDLIGAQVDLGHPALAEDRVELVTPTQDLLVRPSLGHP